MSSISKTPSSVSSSLPTKNITDEDDDDYESPEESGWTTYFEDFFNNNNHNYCSTIMDNNFSSVVVDSCCCSSSSLVSDAASLYATKFVVETVQANNNNKELSMTMRTKKGSSKGSSLMKRNNNNNKNIRKGFIDDALEDTASSPLNSPKVLYEENQLYKVNKYEQHPFHQEKGNGTGIIIRDEERKELGFKKRDSDYTELNKKGLCLVPLSMVINHI